MWRATISRILKLDEITGHVFDARSDDVKPFGTFLDACCLADNQTQFPGRILTCPGATGMMFALCGAGDT